MHLMLKMRTLSMFVVSRTRAQYAKLIQRKHIRQQLIQPPDAGRREFVSSVETLVIFRASVGTTRKTEMKIEMTRNQMSIQN